MMCLHFNIPTTLTNYTHAYIFSEILSIYYIPINVLLKIQAAPSSGIQTSESHFPYHQCDFPNPYHACLTCKLNCIRFFDNYINQKHTLSSEFRSVIVLVSLTVTVVYNTHQHQVNPVDRCYTFCYSVNNWVIYRFHDMHKCINPRC